MQNLIALIKKLSAELDQLRNTNQGLREMALQFDDRFARGDAIQRQFVENETLIFERIEQLNDLVVLLDQKMNQPALN